MSSLIDPTSLVSMVGLDFESGLVFDSGFCELVLTFLSRIITR